MDQIVVKGSERPIDFVFQSMTGNIFSSPFLADMCFIITIGEIAHSYQAFLFGDLSHSQCGQGLMLSWVKATSRRLLYPCRHRMAVFLQYVQQTGGKVGNQANERFWIYEEKTLREVGRCWLGWYGLYLA